MGPDTLYRCLLCEEKAETWSENTSYEWITAVNDTPKYTRDELRRHLEVVEGLIPGKLTIVICTEVHA